MFQIAITNLFLLYIYLDLVLISASTSTSTSEVNILNSHNLCIFQARRLKFCMVVDVALLYFFSPSPPLLISGLDFDLSIDLHLEGQYFK